MPPLFKDWPLTPLQLSIIPLVIIYNYIILLATDCIFGANYGVYTSTDFVNRFFELRNIAVGKLAVGSSTCNYYLDDRKIVYFLFRISFANDGDFSCYNPTDLFKYFSTFYETNPYWMVDLEKPAVVLNVTVQSLGGGYTSWINPFDIRVGNEAANGGSDNPICFFGATLADGEKKNFTCPESEGRYVSINLPRKEQLLLCEVEVYGIFL